MQSLKQNMMKKSIVLFALVFFTATPNIWAQGKGVVRFFVEVDNGYFEIEINDTMLLKRYKDTLPAGHYEAKVWSPGYVTAPISFDIVDGMTTEKHVKMSKNNDFLRYEEEYHDYRMKFHKHLTVPAAFSLTSAVTSWVFMANAYEKRKAIFSDIDLYGKAASPQELEDIKAQVLQNNRQYNRYRTGFFIGTGITLGLVGTTIWSYRKFKRSYEEPTFNKKSPFDDKYSLNFTPYGCSFSIRID